MFPTFSLHVDLHSQLTCYMKNVFNCIDDQEKLDCKQIQFNKRVIKLMIGKKLIKMF